MQVIQVKNRNNTKSRGLFVPDDEWNRLQKNLTRKQDEKATLEKFKQSKIDRKNISEALIDTWDNTLMKLMKIESNRKKKYADDVEAIRQKRDVEAKQELLDRKNEILEKAQSKMWSAKDTTKIITRAVHKIQTSREIKLRKEINDAKALEEKRLFKIKQDLEAEEYKKSLWVQKLNQAKVKRETADSILKEIKTREDIRREEKRKLNDEHKIELQRIAQEIENEKEKEKAILRTKREIIDNNLSETRKLMAAKEESQKFQEQLENEKIEVFNETKQIVSKTRKLKEIELIKEKQKLWGKMAISTQEAEKERKFNVAFQNYIDEKERQYQNEVLQKNNSLKEKKKDLINSKKEFDEEYQKEKERSTLSRQWELERWKREYKMLCDIKELQKRVNIDEKREYRKQLDVQSVNNRATRIANQQAEVDHYEALLKLWHQEDEKFMTRVQELINEYNKVGKSISPLLKAIEEYMEKNKLRLNATNYSMSIPYTSLRKSCF